MYPYTANIITLTVALLFYTNNIITLDPHPVYFIYLGTPLCLPDLSKEQDVFKHSISRKQIHIINAVLYNNIHTNMFPSKVSTYPAVLKGFL